MVVVREVLTDTEALKTVGGKVFLKGQVGQDLLMDQDGVAGHTVDAVADGVVVYMKVSGDLADSQASVDLVVDLFHGKVFFGKVIDGKAHAGKGLPAGAAAVSGDLSGGFCGICAEIPVPVGAVWWGKVGALTVWTV